MKDNRIPAVIGLLLVLGLVAPVFGQAPCTLNIIADLGTSDTVGGHPYSGLIRGSDGNFYGMTAGSGNGSYGTVFQMTPTGVLTVIAAFDGVNEAGGVGNLMQAADGNFYGTTQGGGEASLGTVFRVSPLTGLTIMASFNGANGSDPCASLTQGNDGNFYGTTYSGGGGDLGTVFKMTPAGELTTLVSFDATNGSNPCAGLAKGSDGSFYGVAWGGGSNDMGTVFRVTPSGVLTVLAAFSGSNGAHPTGSLIQGSDGNFYGTTTNGGTNGYGSVFSMTPAGSLNSLASFNFTDGACPYSQLVQGSDGGFYGTTETGGDSYNGTVFRLAQDGVLSSLFSFSGTDGAKLYAGLVQGADGTFYGTAANGGTDDAGVIFQLIVPLQAAAPTFNPAAGTYLSAQTVTIASTTSGATIRYTADGSTPTATHGTVYSVPLMIAESVQLRAIAVADGVGASAVVAADYVIRPISAPVFTPSGGTYHGSQVVTIATADSGATIRYTIDGSTPTRTHGIVYCGQLTISASTTVKAKAYRTGSLDSDVSIARFIILPPQTLDFEAENLSYTGKGANVRVVCDRRASGGRLVELMADDTGDSIDFKLHAVPAELYQLRLTWKGDEGGGIVRINVDGKAVGCPLDQYSAGNAERYGTTAFGSIYLSAGDHVVSLVVAGRNRCSRGFLISADKFTVVGQ